MWVQASLIRRFTDTNIYGTSSVKMKNLAQNIRGYTDILYSVCSSNAADETVFQQKSRALATHLSDVIITTNHSSVIRKHS